MKGACGSMKGKAAEIVGKLLEMVMSRLIAGEDVPISGFGKGLANPSMLAGGGTRRQEKD